MKPWYCCLLLLLLLGCADPDTIPAETLEGTWYSEKDYRDTYVEFEGRNFAQPRPHWYESYTFGWKGDTVVLTGYNGHSERLKKAVFSDDPAIIVDSLIENSRLCIRISDMMGDWSRDTLIRASAQPGPELLKIGYSTSSYWSGSARYEVELHAGGAALVYNKEQKEEGQYHIFSLSQASMDSIWEAAAIANVHTLKSDYCCSGNDGGKSHFSFHFADTTLTSRISDFDIPGRMQKLIYLFRRMKLHVDWDLISLTSIDTTYAFPVALANLPAMQDTLAYYALLDSADYQPAQFTGNPTELRKAFDEWSCRHQDGANVWYAINEEGRLIWDEGYQGWSQPVTAAARSEFNVIAGGLPAFIPGKFAGKPIRSRDKLYVFGCD